MPVYTFRHRESQAIHEATLTMAAREEFLATHPEYEQVILQAPVVGDPIVMGVQKPPTDFVKYVRDPILARNRSTLEPRTRAPREI